MQSKSWGLWLLLIWYLNKRRNLKEKHKEVICSSWLILNRFDVIEQPKSETQLPTHGNKNSPDNKYSRGSRIWNSSDKNAANNHEAWGKTKNSPLGIHNPLQELEELQEWPSCRPFSNVPGNKGIQEASKISLLLNIQLRQGLGPFPIYSDAMPRVESASETKKLPGEGRSFVLGKILGRPWLLKRAWTEKKLLYMTCKSKFL